MFALLTSEAPNVPTVVLMGVGVVFIGLVCIIGLVELMTFLCNKFVKDEPKKETEPVASNSAVVQNRSEIVAAVCCAVAEELGTDVSAIRVKSFKKIN